MFALHQHSTSNTFLCDLIPFAKSHSPLKRSSAFSRYLKWENKSLMAAKTPTEANLTAPRLLRCCYFIQTYKVGRKTRRREEAEEEKVAKQFVNLWCSFKPGLCLNLQIWSSFISHLTSSPRLLWERNDITKGTRKKYHFMLFGWRSVLLLLFLPLQPQQQQPSPGICEETFDVELDFHRTRTEKARKNTFFMFIKDFSCLLSHSLISSSTRFHF